MQQTLIEGKYEVLAKIKEGGMGAIYKVRHVLLDEVRVIKVMRPQIEETEEARKRFYQEAKMATSLKHPNIAALLDFLEDQNHTFYMVMEYIEGVNLSEFVNTNGVPLITTTLEMTIQSLQALSYLHKRGIVHRDISPENIMLTHDHDGNVVVKLIDLGVAKFTESEGMTQAGVFVGKLKYGSPEQFGSLEQGKKIDGRSDLYSLGCVLYQTLTGQTPFKASSTQDFILAHLMKPPRPFAEVDPDGRVPEDLRQVVLKSLEKKREDRFATAEEFGEALRGVERRIRSEVETGTRALFDANLQAAAAAHPKEIELGSDRKRVEKQLAKAFGAAQTPASPVEAVRTTSDTEETQLSPDVAKMRTAETEAVTGATPAPSSGKKRLAVTAGAIVAAAAVLVIAVLLLRHPTPPPPVQTGALLVTSTPWGRISVASETGDRKISMPMTMTPARLTLPPGRYKVTVVSDSTHQEQSQVAEVVASAEKTMHIDLPGAEETVGRAVAALAP